jgi:formiminoglutamase
MPYTELLPYLESNHFATTNTTAYNKHQLGANIATNISHASFAEAQVVLVGCACQQGNAQAGVLSADAANAVRKQLYAMYNWHTSIAMADAGNVVVGNTLKDSHAALDFVLATLHKLGKIVVVIGGSHNLTLSQYNAFAINQEVVDASVVDMLMDLDESETIAVDNFLYSMLTETPNYIRHFNLMGFQSYFTNPTMLETLDKLHFDCHRLGKVREDIHEMEPIFRQSDFCSFDINAVKHSDAPCNKSTSPNGLHGDEVCSLTRFAGMSDKCCSLGIYGYLPENDTHDLTAILIAQMIWYFVDGIYFKQHESNFEDKTQFNEFHVNMTGHDVSFIQSKRSNRWWMRMPNKNYIACTRNDYLCAANNDIPDRWMREMERSV